MLGNGSGTSHRATARRSKVETTFHRYKAILGSAMRARGLASQRVEVRLGCKILNTMTALGIPVGGEFVGIRHRSIFGSREPGVPREVVRAGMSKAC